MTAGDCQTVAEWDADFAEFEFWTRWHPPLAGITAIAAMFPSLNFRLKYEEMNCELLGIVNWSDGNLVRMRAA